MPRVSNKVKASAEKHERTMIKYPTFKQWAKKHLRLKEFSDDLEKAFNYLQGNDNGEEATGLRPADED